MFETNVEDSLKRCEPEDVEYSITIVLQVNTKVSKIIKLVTRLWCYQL